jgi:hypothetical protein
MVTTGGSSFPPKPCRRCGRGDANWIVSALGCAHCFDPFATAAELATLQRVAVTAEDVVSGRRSLQMLEQVLQEWKGSGSRK